MGVWNKSQGVQKSSDVTKQGRETVYTFNFFFLLEKYKIMSLKNPKTLKNCYENLQSQMPELQFLKTLIFPGAL